MPDLIVLARAEGRDLTQLAQYRAVCGYGQLTRAHAQAPAAALTSPAGTSAQQIGRSAPPATRTRRGHFARGHPLPAPPGGGHHTWRGGPQFGKVRGGMRGPAPHPPPVPRRVRVVRLTDAD